MTTAVITEYWRSGRDRYRIQIWPDPDCESPREGSNGSLLWTWESKFCSPDSRSSVDVPDYLNAAIERWCGHNDYSRPVNAAALVRYCAYLQDRVYAVGGLQRSVNGELMVDWSPEPGGWYDGLALVVKGAWEQRVGAERPLAIQAAALLEQELDTYNRWGRGECYGYVVKRAVPGGWEELPEGSCWGYVEEPDGHPLEEARRCLPDGAERIDVPATGAEEPPADLYHTEVEGLVDGFRYELCGECGGDLDRHLIGPDPLGKPHAWCVRSTDPEQVQRLMGVVDQQLVDTVEQAVVKARAAAGGDSNDEEIEALQQALECALVRWPEVSHNEEDV